MLTAPGVQYAYDSRNKRVWKGTFSGSTLTAQEAYFYGVDGQKLGTYSLTLNGTQITATTTQTAVFFGSKRVAVNGVAFGQDRLGSNAAGKFFPYGEDRGTPIANDQVKFATYTRDSATSLDYADQRYYSSQFGRFMTADQYVASAGANAPQSWNRYTYVLGDPINFKDPTGRFECGDDEDFEDCGDDEGGGGGFCGFGFHFDPVAGDCEPDGGGPPPAKPPQPTPPNCSLELEYRTAALTGRSHASLVVDDSYGYTFTIQGEPQNYPLPPWGNLLVYNTPGNINNQQWGSTLTSNTDPGLCQQINDLETAENYYSHNEVAYYPWGPNSNSLISWLLQSGYVSRYFTAPPLTTGWNTPLYGTH